MRAHACVSQCLVVNHNQPTDLVDGPTWAGSVVTTWPVPNMRAGSVYAGGKITDKVSGLRVQLHPSNRTDFMNSAQQYLAMVSPLFIIQQGSTWGDFVLNKRNRLRRPFIVLGFPLGYDQVEMPNKWTIPCCGPRGPFLSETMSARALRSTTSGEAYLHCDAQTDCSPCMFVRASCWDAATGDHFTGDDTFNPCATYFGTGKCIKPGSHRGAFSLQKNTVEIDAWEIGACPRL